MKTIPIATDIKGEAGALLSILTDQAVQIQASNIRLFGSRAGQAEAV